MQPLKKHPSINMKLEPPPGYGGAPEITDLYVYKEEGFICSWWGLTWKERLQILFGRPVRLSILSNSHPPVAIDVGTKS